MDNQEWMSTVGQQLSPRASEYASELLHKEVEPLVQNVMSASGLPGNFNFENIDFGSVPPKLTNIRTHRKKKSDGDEKSVIIDGDFDYAGDCDISVSLLGVKCGVRDLHITGRGRVTLKPATKKALPFFVGGAQFCLLDTPEIDFDLAGLADVCDWPIIRQKVRKALYKDINSKIVYPNKITIPLSENVDPMSYNAFAPVGILAVKLHGASNLPKKGGIRSLVGQGYPDAYAKTVVGSERYDSPVIKNTQEPSWDDDRWYEFMLETSEGHRLNVGLYDEDTFSRDEFLGEIFADVEQELSENIANGGQVRITKDLQPNESKHTEYDIQGTLDITIRWMPFGAGAAEDYTGPTRAVASVFVYSCNNLVIPGDPDRMPETRLEIERGAEIAKSPVKANNQHPNFNFGQTFKFGEDWREQTIAISTIDASGHVFGRLNLVMGELENAPLRRKIKSMDEENPQVTITISALIKTL